MSALTRLAASLALDVRLDAHELDRGLHELAQDLGAAAGSTRRPRPDALAATAAAAPRPSLALAPPEEAALAALFDDDEVDVGLVD